jgi:hypothetical protein
MNNPSSGTGQTGTRRGTNGTQVVASHVHPITGANTAGGGDHNHGANGVSTVAQLGNHDHGGGSLVSGHTHTASGNGLIFSSENTNIPDVISINFMIRAL